MTNNNKYSLISFQSSHHAIRGERIAEDAIASCECECGDKTNDKIDNKAVRLIPLPSEISAGCGLVLQLPFPLLHRVLDVFKTEGIAFEDIFIVECTGAEKAYKKFSLERVCT